MLLLFNLFLKSDVELGKGLNDLLVTQAAARQVQTTAMLQSLSKIRHGTAALYQPAIDTNTGEIIFPDNDEYGDYLDEDAWYEWQLQVGLLSLFYLKI